MLHTWLSSWYQQQQQQEPFNDQYEEGDWVEVITPSTKRRQPHNNTEATTSTAVGNDNESIVTEPIGKGLSRQERRAKARFAVKEKKKQARNALVNSPRRKLCLPSSPLSIDH